MRSGAKGHRGQERSLREEPGPGDLLGPQRRGQIWVANSAVPPPAISWVALRPENLGQAGRPHLRMESKAAPFLTCEQAGGSEALWEVASLFSQSGALHLLLLNPAVPEAHSP